MTNDFPRSIVSQQAAGLGFGARQCEPRFAFSHYAICLSIFIFHFIRAGTDPGTLILNPRQPTTGYCCLSVFKNASLL